jgi:Leucine-rich repeat (LRR) protein
MEDDAESSDSGYEMQNDTSDSDYMPSEDSDDANDAGAAVNNANEDMEPDDANEAGPAVNNANEDMEPDDANEAGPAVNNANEDMEPDDANEAGPAVNNANEDMEPDDANEAGPAVNNANEDMEPDDANEAGPAVNNANEDMEPDDANEAGAVNNAPLLWSANWSDMAPDIKALTIRRASREQALEMAMNDGGLLLHLEHRPCEFIINHEMMMLLSGLVDNLAHRTFPIRMRIQRTVQIPDIVDFPAGQPIEPVAVDWFMTAPANEASRICLHMVQIGLHTNGNNLNHALSHLLPGLFSGVTAMVIVRNHGAVVVPGDMVNVFVPPNMTQLLDLDVSGVDGMIWANGAQPWLPLSSRKAVQTLRARMSDILRCPSDMPALKTLDMSKCRGDFDPFPPFYVAIPLQIIPSTSRANIVRLDISGSRLGNQPITIPDDMACLEHLVCARASVAHAFLPETSKQRIKTLDISHTNISHIPEGMGALTHLNVTNNHGIRRDFLPRSSAEKLVSLKATNSTIQNLPQGMSCLTEVNVRNCPLLMQNFLHQTSAGRVRSLDVSYSEIRGGVLPEGMESLADLKLLHSPSALNANFLPPTSRGELTHLDLSGTGVTRVPAALPKLRHLKLEGCTSLGMYTLPDKPFLPDSSTAAIVTLEAPWSNMVRLPTGMTRLTKLDIRGCWGVDEHFLPLGSARSVKTLNARDSGMVYLPPDMVSLTSLDTSGCSLLADNWRRSYNPPYSWGDA